MSEKLSKEIIDQLNDAWLNIDVKNSEIINPFEILRTDDPDEFHMKFTWLLMNPEYFCFICRHILNIDILPMQAMMLREMWSRKFPMLVGSRGLGKAEWLYNPVLTEFGWRTMGSLKVGDRVYSRSGKLCNITGVYPQGKKQLWNIKFYDGRTIDCCEDHLWTVKKGSSEKVLSTKEMYESGVVHRCNNNKYTFKYKVPLLEPIDYPEANLPLDPYLLGCLLGNGSLTTATPKIATDDQFIVDEFRKRLPNFKIEKDVSCNNYTIVDKDTSYDYYKCSHKHRNSFTALLCENGLNVNCEQKFIPEVYKTASIEQRMDLVRGLLDTDGHCTKDGHIEFSNLSEGLVDDLIDVLRSLGIACIKSHENREGQTFKNPSGKECVRKKQFRIYINTAKPVFKLPRKLKNLKKTETGRGKYNAIIEITPTERYDDMQCISVDSPDSTYITKDYIVTHNTFLLSVYCLLRALLIPNRKIVVVGSAFRQSRYLHDYMENIWKNAPILRDLCDDNSGPRRDVDMCKMTLNNSTVVALPIGDGCVNPYTLMTYEKSFGCMLDKNTKVWGNGKYRDIDYYHDNGVKPTKIVTTRCGYSYEGTHNHAMKVLRNSEIQWVRSDQMVVGDRILIDRSGRWHSGDFKCTQDEAYTLGAMIGDGCWTNKYQLRFATKDLEIIDRVNSVFDNSFSRQKDDIHWNMYGINKVAAWVNFWQLNSQCYTNDKTLPNTILSAPQDKMTACLQGLFDTDGHVFVSRSKGGTTISVNFTNTSKRLVEQIQYILLHYGIVSTVKNRNRNQKWNTVYELGIYGKNVKLFAEKIGFYLPRKRDTLLAAISERKQWNSFNDDIPVNSDVVEQSIDRNKAVPHKLCKSKILSKKSFQQQFLQEVLIYCNNPGWASLVDSNIYYDEIVSIKDSECHTHDIHVPEDNEYCANGFFSHNSKIRGQRANDIVADEFASMNLDIFENVIAGFAAVSASPAENVKRMAKEKMAKEKGIPIEKTYSDKTEIKTVGNQIILSGTAYYDFNHFASYWRRWKNIINTKGDPHRIKMDVFNGEEPPASFNWKDYSIIRIPVDLVPKGFMDEGQIARSKATIHNGIYLMEFSACGVYETPVITKEGIKSLGEIKYGDYVLTHKGRFRKVVKTTCRPYHGQVSQFSSYGYYEPLTFTVDHPFWKEGEEFEGAGTIDILSLSKISELTNKQFINSTDLSGDYIDIGDSIYPIPSQSKTTNEQRKNIIERYKSGESARSIALNFGLTASGVYQLVYNKRKPKNSIPKIIPLNEDFGKIIGYYASEGSISSGGKTCGFALDGHVNKDLQYYVDDLSQSIFKSLNIKPKIYSKADSVISLNVNSRILADILKNICPGNCYNKLIDHDTLFSNENFMKGFIIGVWNGDGHIRKNFATIQLANKNLINQIKMVLSYFGINCSFIKPNRPKTSIIKGKVVSQADIWRLNISGSDFINFMKVFYNKEITANQRKNKIWFDKSCKYDFKTRDLIDYNGYVYNLEVEEDHSYSLPNATVHNCFTKDSQGFFKRSLIESCVGTDQKPVKTPSGDVFFDPILFGNKNSKYIMGVDPASEVDNFSIVILEVREDHRRLVYCWTTTRKDHTEKVKSGVVKENNFYSYCARKIRDLMKVFPIVHIAMDAQGGGISVSEALHDHSQLLADEMPIWPIIEEDKEKPSDDEKGLHILELCQFAKYEWYSEANHGLRKDLEDKNLIFPRFDSISIGLSLIDDKNNNRTHDTFEDCVMEIEELKSELSMIEVTQSINGRDRWDTPEIKAGHGKKKRLRKDRYSSLLMANMAARTLMRTPEPKTYLSYGGFAQGGGGSKNNLVEYIGPAWFTDSVKNIY